MQIFENISFTEGEIEAVEKLSSVGKKLIYSHLKKVRKICMENAVLCQKGINYASSSWKTVDQMFIGKEVRTKNCCREHLMLILSFVVTLRVYRVKILSCDIKSSQILPLYDLTYLYFLKNCQYKFIKQIIFLQYRKKARLDLALCTSLNSKSLSKL